MPHGIPISYSNFGISRFSDRFVRSNAAGVVEGQVDVEMIGVESTDSKGDLFVCSYLAFDGTKITENITPNE